MGTKTRYQEASKKHLIANRLNAKIYNAKVLSCMEEFHYLVFLALLLLCSVPCYLTNEM